MGMILAGFTCTMIMFALIGFASSRGAKAQVSDYLVAGRATPPWIAGLSAVASNNSGFMFIGAVGLTYRCGLSAFWLFFAWIAGDYLSWLLVHRKLRARSEAQNNQSVTGFLAHDGKDHQRSLQLLLGCLTVLFLTLYAAAQLKAGSKALESTLHWPPVSGAILGAFMVAAYSFAGGIRASMWTDVAQAMVMIIAMSALVWVCHHHVTPLSELKQQLGAISPDLLKWSPPEATLGVWPYAIGWFVAGFGGVGQPHMIIRAMTVSSPQGVTQMRRIYFSWYIIFSALTMLVGLFARVYFERASEVTFDKEIALPLLADAHLAPLWVGLILAGIFSASMSTADSQVLASSASLTQDIMISKRESYLASKVATLSVVTCALMVALVGPSSVFELVTLAWGLMMTCLAPLMVARVLEWPVVFKHYLAVVILGLAAMLTWKYLLGFGDALYEGAIGFAVSMPLIMLSAHVQRSRD